MSAQQFPVEGQPIGIVGIVRTQETVPGGFLGLNDFPQIAVVEVPVADEGDLPDLGKFAFADFEHEIDPVLRQLDDLGNDRCREPSAAAV